jgi:hypothetical protein
MTVWGKKKKKLPRLSKNEYALVVENLERVAKGKPTDPPYVVHIFEKRGLTKFYSNPFGGKWELTPKGERLLEGGGG